MVKTLSSQCRRYSFDSWSGSKDPTYCMAQPEKQTNLAEFSIHTSMVVLIFVSCICGCSTEIVEMYVILTEKSAFWKLYVRKDT